MSYDIELKDPVTRKTIEIEDPHFMQGGTYALGGTKELWLNVTYNYGKIFRRPEVLGEEGIRTIYGMTGAESIPVLQKQSPILAMIPTRITGSLLMATQSDRSANSWQWRRCVQTESGTATNSQFTIHKEEFV